MKRNLFALWGLCAAACLAQAADLPVLRIGVEATYPPYEYKEPSGKLVGFDIELADAMCAEMKVQCEWVESPFDALIPSLQAKKFDVVHSALSITEKRKATVDFTVPLYQSATKLIAKKGSGLEPTAQSLAGKRVGVLKGTIQEDFAKKQLAPHGVDVKSYADQNLVFLDLLSKRIDASLQEASAGQEGFLKKPEGASYEFAGASVADPSIGAGIGMAVRKNNQPLLDRLNQAYAKVRANGNFNRIMKKYFDYDILN
jgi:lysine/arginine/ornithine transport system substrate-binding protein